MPLIVSLIFDEGTITKSDPFLFRRLSEKEQSLIDQYPQLELVVNFVKTCWQTSEYHTPSFRVFAARILKGIEKALDYIEIDVFNYNYFSYEQTAQVKHSVEEEIFIGKIHNSCQKLRWYLSLSHANAPYAEGVRGAAELIVSSRAFAALSNNLERFDIVAQQVKNEGLAADFPVAQALFELMSGISIGAV
jgi:hypothetical protein